jgi:hypothetical protein
MKRLNEVYIAALKYFDKGLYPIPLRTEEKTPAIKWEAYQKTPPTKAEIKEWFFQYPGRNIAIVTGETTNLTIIDVDSEEGKSTLESYIPDLLTVPVCKTPKGWHYYFKHIKGLRNGVKVLTDCDIRAQGGYIVAPPSRNGHNTFYTWLSELSIFQVTPPDMPESLKRTILQKNTPLKENTNTRSRGISTREIIFDEGGRDETLFHIAHCLVRGGMDEIALFKVLKALALQCNPPYPEKEVMEKIASVLGRVEREERNISDEVFEYVMSTTGLFLSTDVHRCLSLSTRREKKTCSETLSRFVKTGIIERAGNRNGCFRLVDKEYEIIDFKNVTQKRVDIKFPFSIHGLVELMPGNIVTIMGEPNAGKSAFLLNVVKLNMFDHKITYFSSEMGSMEMNARLEKFGFGVADWQFTAIERSENFADVIVPGEGNINIIDFMEIYDNFYLVAQMLNDIYKKLAGAIAIIAIQKNPGRDVGLGGHRSLEKPRLALAISSGLLKIVKAKNWKNQEVNPNGMEFEFKLVNGCKFIEQKSDVF